MAYDLVLKNCYLVDPRNKIEGHYDVAIKAGKVEKVDKSIYVRESDEVMDVAGRVVMPGIIDTHVHISHWVSGEACHKMIARAGVTTALDVGGPFKDVLGISAKHGAGLNIAGCEAVAFRTMGRHDPPRSQIADTLNKGLDDGALGIKVPGGHSPLTPESTRWAFELANEAGAYLVFHVGTTAHGSNLEGLLEAVELIGDLGCQIAHVNSYCRGLIKPPVEESMTAIAALKGKKRLVGESYLNTISADPARCTDGVPASLVARTALRMGGYLPTQDGQRQAIMDGFALICMPKLYDNALVSGEEAVKFWEENNTEVTICYHINKKESCYLLATARDENGAFVVTALATDGGSVPRNTTAGLGMALVNYGALSLSDLAHKASWAPARMLGLVNKGHLAQGADADITILERPSGRCWATVVGGKVVMLDGIVFGSGATIITTARGRRAVEEKGFAVTEVDLSQSLLYKCR